MSEKLVVEANDVYKALGIVSRKVAEFENRINNLSQENAKLRELVSNMWRDGMCECDERGACTTCEYGYLDRMRELGIGVDDA